MKNFIKKSSSFVLNHCASYKTTIKEAMNIIEKGADRICFLIDDENRLLRVVSDGDIRRAILKGAVLNDLVMEIHNRKPIIAHEGQSLEEVQNLFSKRINIVPVLNKEGCVVDILRQREVLPFLDIKSREIAIIGLGYVGLTLALVMADRGFSIIGYDYNSDLIEGLKRKEPPFYEKGLEEKLHTHIGHSFRPISESDKLNADIYIISVGTPIDKKTLRPNKSSVVSAVETVAKRLKSNDLVTMRSTLPIGCTRNLVIPLLEKQSGLKAGEEFFVSMCPERTAEGRALEELKTLPQVVGGLDSKSRELSMRLFSENTHTVIDIGSLEAAEMCKLMDNAYRDIRFAFSNQMSALSEKLGLNLKDLIHKINLGYERNDIPYPSPGVGGACLSKDPYILYNNLRENGLDGGLFLKAREINERAPKDIYERAKISLKDVNKKLTQSKIFIIGFAFKGEPETSDLRDSTTLWFLDKLKKEGVNNIWGYDPIVKEDEIEILGVKQCSINDGFAGADAVFIMNNHSSYNKFQITQLINSMKKPALFFDAWQIFHPQNIAAHTGIIYASIGKS